MQQGQPLEDWPVQVVGTVHADEAVMFLNAAKVGEDGVSACPISLQLISRTGLGVRSAAFE
ncbi:hypothetical protein D5S18_08125 [Nocardia panacis]|uniref:Uncharacterized protein n=1 Tax=Nocardia panacis TaxID=2340916 RepID=A0A3A4KFE3_9NOCA|nr:hypothetical protein D5S18_08125 [Nocardia panacis]